MAKRIKQSFSLVLASVFLLLSASLLLPRTASGEALSVSSISSQRITLLPEEASPLASAPTSLLTAKKTQYEGLRVLVGGIPFGVKFMTEGVMIVGFNDIPTDGGTVNPARKAKLQCGDLILKIGKERPGSAEELSKMIENSGGKPLTIVYSRGGVEGSTTLSPVYSKSEGRYVSGLYVRDSGAGIGTVTFVLPETNAFAGLGHGICDGGTGKLIPMQRGSVVNVTISGVVRGLAGSPGEVKEIGRASCRERVCLSV